MSDNGWEAGRWYRVILSDGSLWCETSSKADLDEALKRVPMAYMVERQYTKTSEKWKRVSGGNVSG